MTNFAQKNFSIKSKKFNEKLNKCLTDKTKLAIHKFKADSKSTIKKSGNLKIYWSTFIKRINYLKNDQIEVYVTDEFKTLSHKKRAQIIESVQQLALSYLDDFKAVTPSKYSEGLAVTVFCGGNQFGRSLFLDNKDFKWND
ncbi:hypothetical protein LBO01_00100 [Companilactobacillus paralimentarius]|uniref:Uncharacterized protein n=1 Tax=Companilactobacillus bobalius TaxID=2801451 RepID=A0A202FEK5_9LACO|nr:hypothetical protein ATN92_10815 [Companilactobacillus bobalius]OVE98905.1 hypothetical protein LKACC16343_00017 [Companilactobacillus bobalius]GEO56881.1 hypothetical protein LBO01_00100 [Companilactobacillus paralimentarius]